MTAPAPTPLARCRLAATNVFIAALLVILAIEAIPQSPLALRLMLARWTTPLGLAQGPWTLYAPGPDPTNMRMRVEVVYRDNERREWTSPNWREQSIAAMWAGHRRREWLTRLMTQEGAPAWQHWGRQMARELRPDLADAAAGATIRIIYEEGPIAAAELKPWRSIREPAEFSGSIVLSSEKVPLSQPEP
jgi:hypothetical protein